MNCDICDIIRENPNLTNVALGKTAGVDEKTVRRHRQKMALAETDDFFGVPSAAITQRGKSYYNRETSSWEIVRYSPQAAAVAEASVGYYEELDKALSNHTPERPAPTRNNATAVFCPADLQTGKEDRNGGTRQTIEKVLKALDTFANETEQSKPAEILIAELGDVIEGFGNTPTQRGTNDLDLTSQIRSARRVMLTVLQRLAPLAPTVTFASVPSNHAAVRIDGTKSFASTPGNDWGIEVNHQLEDVLRDRPGFEHVRFVRPETEYDEALTYETVNGLKVGMLHGHQAGSQPKMADYWAKQAFGRQHGLHEADILLHGHFHNLHLGQAGDERWFIGAASADPGSSWYTTRSGNTATAGVTAFDLSDGAVPWSNLRIL